jgi:hypothetical protein
MRVASCAAVAGSVPSSIPCSSCVCRAGGSSPTSSRNSVPPFACRMRLWICSAVVPAGGASAAGGSVAGCVSLPEPQCTVTKGVSARSLEACTARAKHSWPVPDSPISRMGISRERGAEQFGGALQPEREQRVALERGVGAGAIEGDGAIAPGAEPLRAAVEAHHRRVAEGVPEQPVLDHLGAVGFPRGIEHRDRLTAMLRDRSGAAGEAAVAREEGMLAVHDAQRALHHAGAHAGGAAVLRVPHGPEHPPGAQGGVVAADLSVVTEQHAVAVGENDRVARAGELVVPVRPLGLCERQPVAGALLAGQHVRFALGLGVEVVLTQAARPGAPDGLRGARSVIAPRGRRVTVRLSVARSMPCPLQPSLSDYAPVAPPRKALRSRGHS